MSRATKITVSADGRRNDNSEEHISISLISLATKFHFSSTRCPEGDCPKGYCGVHGVPARGCPEAQTKFGKQMTKLKCSIAVKELIIEWEDYQTEACCYVQCDAIKDQRDYEFDINGSLIIAESLPKVMKPLLRFVKKPGLRTTFIQIPDEKITFHNLALNDLSFTPEISKK